MIVYYDMNLVNFNFFFYFGNAFFTVRNDFTNHVLAENIILLPGENCIHLNAKATRVGIWNFKQVNIVSQNVNPFQKFILFT